MLHPEPRPLTPAEASAGAARSSGTQFPVGAEPFVPHGGIGPVPESSDAGARDSASVIEASEEQTSGRWRDVLALLVLGAVVLLPLPALLRASGAPMEEGFMLAFPEQLLQGRLPHRDFLHLYGPGALWVLAAAYRVLGATIGVERGVAVAQDLVVVGALWIALRPRGRWLATAAAGTAAVILLPLGLAALAWNGALAAALAALALLVLADRCSGRPRTVAIVVAGVLAATAVLYRPDMVLAVVAALVVWMFQLDRGDRIRLGAGFVVTSLLWLVHLVTSGPSESFRGMFLEPVFSLRGGRSLPVPPSWDRIDGFLQRAGTMAVPPWPVPMLSESAQIVVWFWLIPCSIVLALVAAWRLWRTEPAAPATRAYLPLAVYAALLLPQALQRPDTTHLSWVSAVTFPAAIAAVPVLLVWARPSMSRRLGNGVAIGAAAVVLVVVIPFFPFRTYVEAAGHTLSGTATGFDVRRGDRTFPYGSAADAAAAQQVVDELDARARPGESIVVGTNDLSRTVYSDAWIYHLFPDLVPGTRYIEMDPGLADGVDSELPAELAAADWLILSDVWSDWDEPNDSRSSRSQAANDVVASSFCEVTANDRFRLLQRCDR